MGYKKSVFRSLAMVTQLGLCVMTPILFSVFAGNYIDSRYGTKIMVFFLILGTLGGGRGAYLMAKRQIDREAKEEKQEQQRMIREVLDGETGAVVRPKTPSRIRSAKEKDTVEDKEDLA